MYIYKICTLLSFSEALNKSFIGLKVLVVGTFRFERPNIFSILFDKLVRALFWFFGRKRVCKFSITKW